MAFLPPRAREQLPRREELNAEKNANISFSKDCKKKLREFLEQIAPSQENRQRQQLAAVQLACRSRRRGSRRQTANGQQKRQLVAKLMHGQFDMP